MDKGNSPAILIKLGESPVWSSAEQAVYWIDWQRQVLYRQTLTSDEAETWEFDQRIGCLAPLRDHGVILGLERTFVSLDPRTKLCVRDCH